MSLKTHMTVSLIVDSNHNSRSLPTSVQQATFWKSKNMGFWSSRKDKNAAPSVPTGKKRKGSNKSVQQAARSKENTKHATAATSGREQRGDRSTNGIDASRHSFYENNSTDNKRESYHAGSDTSEHPDNEVRNFQEVRTHERGKQEREKEEKRKQMGYGSESSRYWDE
ncbi:hypothetical protein BTUL_0090g00320 [Botrytis tulipae]|uniref:Uncharacterized protein n=1 Tax=Botrytis tulipae TaxID=87230 RepID=A0A4Z1ET75_9HELO|nr:hypothetical protein BTUL_0090g00320 [Botrytis tulipae]